MKRFRDYLREEKGLDVDAMFPDHEKPLGAVEDDQDTEALFKIARIAIENHYEEVLSFFHTLGQKDHRIQDELDDMSRHQANRAKPRAPRGNMPPGYPGDNENEVVPSGADRADGSGTEQDS